MMKSFNSKLYTLTSIKDPVSVMILHKNTPPAISHLLLYLSPQYPKIGAKSMYDKINAVCRRPPLSFLMTKEFCRSVRTPVTKYVRHEGMLWNSLKKEELPIKILRKMEYLSLPSIHINQNTSSTMHIKMYDTQDFILVPILAIILINSSQQWNPWTYQYKYCFIKVVHGNKSKDAGIA